MTGRWVSPVKHDRTCLVMKSHLWMLTGNDRTLGFSVRPLLAAASGRHLTVEIGRLTHPTLCPVKGYNGSISWGLLFKPHGWLKLTLLDILH